MDLSDVRGVYDHPLSYLDVRGNRLASVDDLIKDLSEYKCLKYLLVSDEPLTVDDNPICTLVDFRIILFNGLPQILKVDSYSREVSMEVPSIVEAGTLIAPNEEKIVLPNLFIALFVLGCTFLGDLGVPYKVHRLCVLTLIFVQWQYERQFFHFRFTVVF